MCVCACFLLLQRTRAALTCTLTPTFSLHCQQPGRWVLTGCGLGSCTNSVGGDAGSWLVSSRVQVTQAGWAYQSDTLTNHEPGLSPCFVVLSFTPLRVYAANSSRQEGAHCCTRLWRVRQVTQNVSTHWHQQWQHQHRCGTNISAAVTSSSCVLPTRHPCLSSPLPLLYVLPHAGSSPRLT